MGVAKRLISHSGTGITSVENPESTRINGAGREFIRGMMGVGERFKGNIPEACDINTKDWPKKSKTCLLGNLENFHGRILIGC